MTSKNIKILVTFGRDFAPLAKKSLDQVSTVHYKVPTQEWLDKNIQNYDYVVIGLGLTFYKKTLENAKKLSAIATATTGLDHIDLSYAKKLGIEVISLRNENDFLDTITGVGELAIGMIISLMRHIPSSFDAVKQYKWIREDHKGYNLRGKTIGIVGLGRLGAMTARFAHGLDMNVIYCSPNTKQSQTPKYKKVSFKELLKQSDVVSVHVHLTKDTTNMFGAKEFALMKQNALLINTSRGKIVNERELLQALKGGAIGGYATDVLAGEIDFAVKGFKKDPLVEYARVHRNCLILPHTGGMTHDSRIATDIFIAKKLVEFIKTKKINRANKKTK